MKIDKRRIKVKVYPIEENIIFVLKFKRLLNPNLSVREIFSKEFGNVWEEVPPRFNRDGTYIFHGIEKFVIVEVEGTAWEASGKETEFIISELRIKHRPQVTQFTLSAFEHLYEQRLLCKETELLYLDLKQRDSYYGLHNRLQRFRNKKKSLERMKLFKIEHNIGTERIKND